MNLIKLLDKYRQKRAHLDIIILALEAEVGPSVEGKARRTITQALALDAAHQANGNGAKRGPYKKRGTGEPSTYAKSYFYRSNREIKPVALPKKLSLDGIELPEAIVLALRAVKQPLGTAELVDLLTRAGADVKMAGSSMPPMRYVGLNASVLARDKRIKKTPTGWALGKG